MIAIICGQDRTGKSTLINQLRKTYFKNPKTIVHHSSSPPKVENPNQWEIEHYRNILDTAIEMSHNQGYDFIFDRLHLGAIVYGKKYRNADPKLIYGIDKHFLTDEKDVFLVLLTDYSEAILAIDDGESLETNVEDYEYTRTEFIDAFNKSVCVNKLHINITDNGGFKNTYETVVKFLDEKHR